MSLPNHLIESILNISELSIDTRLGLAADYKLNQKQIHIDPHLKSSLDIICKRRAYAYRRKKSELVHPLSCALDYFTKPLGKSKIIEFIIDVPMSNVNNVVMNVHIIKNEVNCLRKYYHDMHTGLPCPRTIDDWDDDD